MIPVLCGLLEENTAKPKADLLPRSVHFGLVAISHTLIALSLSGEVWRFFVVCAKNTTDLDNGKTHKIESGLVT